MLVVRAHSHMNIISITSLSASVRGSSWCTSVQKRDQAPADLLTT